MATKRGRKSAAELATPRALRLNSRLDPSPSLTDEQAAVWVETLAGLAPDWIQPEAREVMAAYCRHAVAIQRIAACVKQYEASADEFDFARYNEMLKAQERETRALGALATRLRLTPQSRYTPATAARKPRDDANKPWTRHSHEVQGA